MLIKGTAAVCLIALSVSPALSESAVTDHAELWDQLRDRSNDQSSEVSEADTTDTKQASQNDETTGDETKEVTE
ncbi:MAG: hypothetical protein AAGC81_16580 [Pseudomonadota bacterium]